MASILKIHLWRGKSQNEKNPEASKNAGAETNPLRIRK